MLGMAQKNPSVTTLFKVAVTLSPFVTLTTYKPPGSVTGCGHSTSFLITPFTAISCLKGRKRGCSSGSLVDGRVPAC